MNWPDLTKTDQNWPELTEVAMLAAAIRSPGTSSQGVHPSSLVPLVRHALPGADVGCAARSLLDLAPFAKSQEERTEAVAILVEQMVRVLEYVIGHEIGGGPGVAWRGVG